ncbi:hypothetical protein [Streptomyces boninensis]|uniref:hypothetical protein n=1 Tax=Streptomyces boninensis TaxID=2039455 RepID=UPI003B2143E3
MRTPDRTPEAVTAAIAFTPRQEAQSPQCRGRIGEPRAYTYYRCMVVAYASLRRFNPRADLVLVTTEPLPGPFAAEFACLGVEVLTVPFRHCPPAEFGRGWETSLYLIDALQALRDRPGTLVLSDPDQLCVRPLDALLERCAGRVGVQGERLADLQKPTSDKTREYRQVSAEVHAELGEPDPEHNFYGGHFYAIPDRLLGTLLDRLEKVYAHSLARFEQGRPWLWTDEHMMNFALRKLPLAEMSADVRSIPTAPWRRFLTDRQTILGLTLWHLIHEKDLGFQRLHPPALDAESWFWSAGDEEFRSRAGRILSATGRSPQRALLNACGDLVERLTTERLQHRLKPVYSRMVQLTATMRQG